MGSISYITESGFDRPSFDELVAVQEERAKQLFGETIDTSNNSVIGKFIRLLCYDLDNAYQELEQCYFARFPNTASGQSLDRLATFVAISRNEATYAYHIIEFTGNPDSVIEAGFLVATKNDVQFHTLEDLTIGENGKVSGIVEANEAGTVGNVTVGSISVIVNPSANVSSIRHIATDELGEGVESDSALRDRFSQALAGGGSATYAAIKSEVLRVAQVNSVVIRENDTDDIVDSIPPHSFCIYVDAPESQNQAVGEAIFSKKPIGIGCVGDIAVNVTDVSGDIHTVYFSKVVNKRIYCKVTVAKNNDFETTGASDIQQAIANKINSLKNGNDIIRSSLYESILKVDGVMDIKTLYLSSDGKAYSSANVIIANNETAKIAETDIEVTVVDYVDL